MKLELQIQFPWGLISFTQKKILPNFPHNLSHLFWKFTHQGKKSALHHSPFKFHIIPLLLKFIAGSLDSFAISASLFQSYLLPI
jgi:hypothetical protein